MQRKERARSYTAVAMAGSFLSLVMARDAHAAGTVLAGWTFETSLPTNAGPFTPESGVNAGTSAATGSHAGTSTYNNVSGNGSSHSFSSNNWATGDYYQFVTSTTGYMNTDFAFDHISSGTGPANFDVRASLDGTNFNIDLGTYSVLNNTGANTWNSTSKIAGSQYDTSTFSGSVSLSLLDNQPMVYFRLVDNSTSSASGGAVGSGGTSRVDNIVVSGTAIGTINPTWSGGGLDNNWSTAANWNVVPSEGSNIVFTGTQRTTNTNDLGVNTLGSITFDANAGSFTLTGNALKDAGGITNASSNPQNVGIPITLVASQTFSGNLTLSAPVTLGSNVLTVTGSGMTVFTGGISGLGASGNGVFVKTGAGTLSFQGTSNAFGKIDISGGAVNIPAGSSIDTEIGAVATAIWDNATLTGAGTLHIGSVFRPNPNAANGTLQINSGFDGTAFSGPVLVTGSAPTGAGEIVVRSANSPLGTGILTVDSTANGLAIAANSQSIGALSNPIVLNGADNSFTLFAGATNSATTGPATLSLGPISGTGRLVVELPNLPLAGPTSAPNTNGGGNVNLQGASSYTGDTVFNLTNTGIIKNLADNALPTTTNLTFGANSGFGGIYDLNGHNQQIASLSSGGNAIGQILDNAAGSGTDTLSISGSNNGNFALPISDAAGTRAIALSLPATNSSTVGILGAVNIHGGVSVNGGTLFIQNGGSLSANITIGSTGTVNFDGPVVSSTITNNGVLHQTSGNSTLGAITGNLSGAGVTTIDGIATADSVRQNTLNVNGTLKLNQNGSNTIVVSNLNVGDNTFFASGHLDLNDNDLIIPYTGASPLSTIEFLVHLGYNFNAGGTWDGNGINSSAANGNSLKNTALGVGEAKDLGITTLDGNAITGNAVIVKYTYNGDSSLDGKVDLGNDFDLFLQGYLGGGGGWEFGDYNYDGVVNNTDFDIFIDGYKSQGNSLGALEQFIELSPELSNAQKSALLSAVPEPTCTTILLATCGLLVRRRKICAMRN